MRHTPAQLLQEYLEQHDMTPQEFAQISAMPLAEVKGILDGELPVTTLRANHLAAVFDTDPDRWLNLHQPAKKMRSRSSYPVL